MGHSDMRFWIGLSGALVAFTALVALPATILITFALIHLFRSKVRRSMRAAVGALAHPGFCQVRANRPTAPLQTEAIRATGETARRARAVPLLAEARRRARRLAPGYALAACVYSAVLATAMASAVEFSPARRAALAYALLYGVMCLENGAPAALAPTLVLDRRPRALILAVLALVAALWATGRAIGSDPAGVELELWLCFAGVPTGAVVLLNTRRLRAIGPTVFAALLLLLYGLGAGGVYASFYALEAAGPVRVKREDLARLPGLEALERYWSEVFSLPPVQMADAIAAALADPSGLLMLEDPGALTAEVRLSFVALWAAAALAGAGAAWAFLRWLARRYQARRASDQMLGVDVLMATFAVWGSLLNFVAFGWVAAAGAPAGFFAYKLVVRWRLRRLERAGPSAPVRVLLLLRVFGFDRRAQRLLDDVGRRWRHLGPVRLIGGPDLAYATLEPHEFFEFLSGRITRAFVKGRGDLERRLSGRVTAPDPDGLFRVEDFFCHEDTWRAVVSGLIGEADAVLMDLRGFTRAHQGCVFEIEQLIASAPLRRIVLLVDASTDAPFLEQTLQRAWRAVPDGSPNAGGGTHQRLRILHASPSHRQTLESLLGLLCQAPADGCPRQSPQRQAASLPL
jgi:hypothetical protein